MDCCRTGVLGVLVVGEGVGWRRASLGGRRRRRHRGRCSRQESRAVQHGERESFEQPPSNVNALTTALPSSLSLPYLRTILFAPAHLPVALCTVCRP
jgi:hypothetical protein